MNKSNLGTGHAGYRELGAAVVKQAYDDLVRSYKSRLALTYGEHYKLSCVRNYKSFFVPLDNAVYGRAVKQSTECKEFFATDRFLDFAPMAKVSGAQIIRRAKKEAVEWFAGKDELEQLKRKKLQDKLVKKALRRRKRNRPRIALQHNVTTIKKGGITLEVDEIRSVLE